MAEFARYYRVESSGDTKITFEVTENAPWRSVVARGVDANDQPLAGVTIRMAERNGTLESRAGHKYEIIFKNDELTEADLADLKPGGGKRQRGDGITFTSSDRDPPPPPPDAPVMEHAFNLGDVVRNF